MSRKVNRIRHSTRIATVYYKTAALPRKRVGTKLLRPRYRGSHQCFWKHTRSKGVLATQSHGDNSRSDLSLTPQPKYTLPINTRIYASISGGLGYLPSRGVLRELVVVGLCAYNRQAKRYPNQGSSNALGKLEMSTVDILWQ